LKAVLQLQIKSRRTAKNTDLVYHLIWPRERKGESVLLRKTGTRAPAASLFVPPDTHRALTAAEMKQGLFGTNLSAEDVIENFFAWEHQTLAGTEVVDGVTCQILESRPGKGEWASCARVRSWIDLKRNVPLRVEKYLASGALGRRIDTTKVVKDDDGRHIPATLLVRRPGQDSTCEFQGTRSTRGVAYTDSDFTPEGLKNLAAPRSAPE